MSSQTYPMSYEGGNSQRAEDLFEDLFFINEPGLIKTYTFDREKMIAFNIKLAQNECWGNLAQPPLCICIPCIAYSIFFLLVPNTRDTISAIHIAITVDGIKVVEDAHKTGSRLDCQDVGRTSKTVAYSKISVVDIVEPAGVTDASVTNKYTGKSGPWCCMIDNVLTVVHVDTARDTASRYRRHSLSISGLSDPHAFKRDVWAMIKGEGVNGIKPRVDNFTRVVGGSGGNTMDRGDGGKSVVERMTDLEALRDKGYVDVELVSRYVEEFDVKRREFLASA